MSTGPNFEWMLDAMESDIKSLEAVEFQCNTCEYNCGADCHGSCRQYPCGQQHCWWSLERADLEKQLDEIYDDEEEDDYDCDD